MLALLADAKALKKNHEDKKVVYAEGGFDGVAGHKLERGLVALGKGNPTGKAESGRNQREGDEPGNNLGMAGCAAVE